MNAISQGRILIDKNLLKFGFFLVELFSYLNLTQSYKEKNN